MTHPTPPPTSPDATRISLGTRLTRLPGIQSERGEKLLRLGLKTVRDTLFFFPRQYHYPPPLTRVDALKEGQQAGLTGKITDVELVSRTPGKSVFAAILENESGAVRLVFFNQPFRAEQLTFDVHVRIAGTPKLSGLRWEFTHPEFEILSPEEVQDATRDQGSIVPVYPLTEGIKQSDLRRLTRRCVEACSNDLTEVMPAVVRRTAAERLRGAGTDVGDCLPEIAIAIRDIHHPSDDQSLKAAQTRLIFQELFVMQLALALRRRALTTNLRSPPLACDARTRARILRRFPFELTRDQLRVIDEVTADLSRQFPMNRLLQGDVGSGKTVVAIFAMLLAVASGHQATLMAPTEVLAQQHVQTLRKLLADSKVRVELLSGSLSAAERRETIQATQRGDVHILIGTQALVFGIEFRSLALCVIDEQHKFGVKQRIHLRTAGTDPHSLVMSATPIPRSVAMTQFGDVDLSTLRDKPAGRGGVHTYLADEKWRVRWWDFVAARIAEGRQAFVVAPRVGQQEVSAAEPFDGAPDEDVTSVSKTFSELTRGPLKNHRVGLLHGRLPHEEKQLVMHAFAEGELDVLVSTSVIEVGIDVPNATVMTILGGNRFGLAQLHQLRGRVSRGSHAGHVCVFVDGNGSPESDERLRVFQSTEDGFELAEADFKLRGPGDVLGRRQSGDAALRIADLTRDQEILQVARTLAQEMIDEDPDLADPSLGGLRSQVLKRYGDRLDLADGA